MAKQLSCIALALLVTTSAFAASTSHTFRVGAWDGGAYTDDSTGAFSHCAAATPYKSGILFFVGVDAGWGWSLGFAHQSWSLREGETIPIDLTFDSRSPFRVFGTATRIGNEATVNFVKVHMPGDSRLINSFRRAYVMQAFAKGNVYGFNLDDTAQLLPALANCVTVNIANPGANRQPEQTISSLKADGAIVSELSPELQIEAIQLATNFMLKSRLQNPRVLSRTETPTEFASFGAAWASDEAVGAVKIIPPDPNIKGLDVAAAIAGADAKECKGKFASGRLSELVDSEVVFRGFSSCEDTDGSRSAQFFVVPRKQGGFIIFSVASNLENEASRQAIADDNLAGFQKAALSASQ
jgi:hypothetical protein